MRLTALIPIEAVGGASDGIVNECEVRRGPSLRHVLPIRDFGIRRHVVFVVGMEA